jgi:phospholipase A1
MRSTTRDDASVRVLLWLGTLFFTPLAAGANGEACRQLVDRTERLTCYDTAFGVPARAVVEEDLSRLERLIVRRNAGYAQQSYWQVYAQDEPFRETDHEPELLLDVPMNHHVLGFDLKAVTLALNHQSNGLIDPVSRSWNRLIGSAVFERGNLVMAVRPWIRLSEDDDDDDNPNIEQYMGQIELGFGYRWHEQSFAAVIKNNLRADNKSGVQLDWSFPLTLNGRGYLQYYAGYGENLIDGPENTNRIGIMLSDWY